MATEKKIYAMLLYAFNVLLVITALFLLSIWADRKSGEVEGPVRLVRGPDNTVYVQVDRIIAKVSSDGDLLSVLDLDTDASVPDLADFFVEGDGRFLIARRNSPLLRYYSPEGKLLSTLGPLPSLRSRESHSGSLTKDPSTGIVYFADTSRNAIRMVGPDGKEVKTITTTSGSQAPPVMAEAIELSNLEKVYSPKIPIRSPNGLTFANDRLIAADTGNSRILVFSPDGSLDKIIPVFPLDSSRFTDPVRVDRFGDAIYVVVRGPGLVDGELQSFELNTGLPRRFRASVLLDPVDVLVRRDDVLAADRTSLRVMRYAHSGLFLGVFGKPGVQSLYAASQLRRKTYAWIGKGLLAGVAAVFVWVLFSANVRMSSCSTLLGPAESSRRKMLLLIPGLGQDGAGRPLRAGILQLVLLYFISFFGYSWLQYRNSPSPLALPLLITTGLMAYSVWIGVVLDGIRLAARRVETEYASAVRLRIQSVFGPLITLCGAAAIQLLRDLLVYVYPDAPPAIQQLFSLLITFVHGNSSPLSVALPASLLFGWAGAGAALFGTFAWQANGKRSEIATALVLGFVAGLYAWLFTAVLVARTLDWTPYAPPVLGLMLGIFTWLYFRRNGTPVLIVPAAVAGAWIGYFLKFFFGFVAGPIGKHLSAGGGGAFWTGAIARLELILMPAVCIHLAVWITEKIAREPRVDQVQPPDVFESRVAA